MATVRDTVRAVFAHGWQDPSEWACAVAQLADLSYDEIDRLVENASHEGLAGVA